MFLAGKLLIALESYRYVVGKTYVCQSPVKNCKMGKLWNYISNNKGNIVKFSFHDGLCCTNIVCSFQEPVNMEVFAYMLTFTVTKISLWQNSVWQNSVTENHILVITRKNDMA